MIEVIIKDIPVKFPFQPYELQKDYMERVIDCLQQETNGVLESPTGTGKTLSLLCSSLAWLERMKAQKQFNERVNLETDSAFLVDGLLTETEMKAELKATNKALLGIPTIIYASRTHSQLTQAMGELKKTAYNYMKANVLGSREQMCINPELQNEQPSFKLQMCKLKTKTRSCSFHNNVDKLSKVPEVRNTSVVDIEDIVTLGEKHKFCPYFMTKELKKQADIIFTPYNYLLDPIARKALGVELANNVVILDEAHNIERICEDSASFQIKATDITLAIEDVTSIMKFMSEDNLGFSFTDQPRDFSAEELCDLKQMLLDLESQLDKIDLGSKEETTLPGNFIFELFGKANINDQNCHAVLYLLERITQFLVTVNQGPFQRSGGGLQILGDLLRIVFISTSKEFKDKVLKCYKVHVKLEQPPKKTSDNWLAKAMAAKKAYRVLSYWCFSPGFGMNMLMNQGIRSLILTSGTLAPLKPLISELELKVQVQLENPHIVNNKQVCVKIIPQGPDGELLNCNFQNRDNPKYINSLGRTILNIVRFIPNGLLIFFPSYPIMLKFREFWEKNGIWNNLNEQKAIFVEPKDKNSFNIAMNDYYTKIKDSTCKGAIFMGVCRGKVSEGLDFIDANGRAVIIIGLPYPPIKDPRVILKRQYLDRNAIDKEYLKGNEWYSLEATRAVNQAIGRVIRHKNDYGAILLLDSRFNSSQVKSQLSRWLRDRIQVVNNFGSIIVELKQFYKNAESSIVPYEKIDSKENDSQKREYDLSIVSNERNSESSSNSASGCSRDSSFGEVHIYKKDESHPEENPAKRKKIIIIPNKKNSASLVTSSKEYMTMVKKSLDKDSFTELARGLSNYKTTKNFDDLKSCLNTIFLNKFNLRYLIGGLEIFIHPDHKNSFKEYWSTMQL